MMNPLRSTSSIVQEMYFLRLQSGHTARKSTRVPRTIGIEIVTTQMHWQSISRLAHNHGVGRDMELWSQFSDIAILLASLELRPERLRIVRFEVVQ